MKAATLTTSKRPQSRTIVNSEIKSLTCKGKELTVSAPLQDSPKNLLITFSEQELRAMLNALEVHIKDTTSFI